MQVSVADEGIGIAEDDLERACSSRLHAKTQDSIGLSVCAASSARTAGVFGQTATAPAGDVLFHPAEYRWEDSDMSEVTEAIVSIVVTTHRCAKRWRSAASAGLESSPMPQPGVHRRARSRSASCLMSWISCARDRRPRPAGDPAQGHCPSSSRAAGPCSPTAPGDEGRRRGFLTKPVQDGRCSPP